MRVFNYKTGQWEDVSPNYVYGGSSSMNPTSPTNTPSFLTPLTVPNPYSTNYPSSTNPLSTLTNNNVVKNPVTTTSSGTSSGSNINDLIAEYKRRGWNDEAAIKADIAATGGKSTSAGGRNVFSDFVGLTEPEIDKYVNDLISFANEDYDFAAKWLESQFKIALGNDDTERANFIKSVANELESKIGTIAYDYQTGKYRTERDTKLALTRLDEDERVAHEELNTNALAERERQNANLNQRGLIAGPREGAEGLGGENVRRLETDIGNRYATLQRFYDRNKTDINTSTGDRLADLMTTARRAAAGSQNAYDYGIESAERTKKRAIDQANLAGQTAKWSLSSYFPYLT